MSGKEYRDITTLVLCSSQLERDAAIEYVSALPPSESARTQWLGGRQSAVYRLGICGVGPVNAALGADREIRADRTREVIFIGTCGTYPGSGVEVGSIVAAGEILLTSADVVEGRMRLPELAGGMLSTDTALTAKLVSSPGDPLHTVRVACTIGITEHNLSALALGDVAHVETMEVYGVACAARENRLPFAALLGVTNMVGEEGGAEWRRNFREMMGRVLFRMRDGLRDDPQ